MTKKIDKKKKKKSKVIPILLLVMTLILVLAILYVNILPVLYVLFIIIGLLLVDSFLVLMMLKGKKKKFFSFIAIIVAIIMGYISYSIFNTTDLLNNLNLNYKTYNYSVIVRGDSDYSKIHDLDNKSLGYYETDGDEDSKALKKLEKKVNLSNTKYDDTATLASSLLNDDVDAILLDDSYLAILNENADNNADIANFNNNSKVIYKFKIVVKTSDISKDLDVTKKAFNIYVSGIDTYGEISSVSRSDVNMIVTVNPSTRQILLTSIPRDYYVKLHGKSGYNDKLTHAGLFGTDMSIQTLEDLLDIEINYYIKVNFTSVIDIVNAIGGVEVYSDYSFTSIDNYSYSKGYNKVNGEEALSFARERKAFAAGDRQRVKDQQSLLEAIFRKCTSTSIITRYNSLLKTLENSFVTNMPTDRLTSLVKMQIAKKYKWTITTNSLDGSDASNYTYSCPSQKLYVMEPIEESVDYASTLISSVLEGEKLDPSYDGNASDVHNVTSNKKNNSSSSSSSKNNSATKNGNSSNSNSATKKEGLKAKIGKASVTLVEGDEFIYYGYTATYNGTDVTNSSSVSFSINGKTFNDYYSLISYVSNNLSAGSYNIVYKISYNKEVVNLNQNVTVEKLKTNNNQEPKNDSESENQEKDTANVDTTLEDTQTEE